MNRITLIYLNWKRNHQLKRIIEDAKKQTERPKIIVIDNSSNDIHHKIDVTEVEYIPSDNKNQCWERWVHAVKTDTEYVCVMDDDLTFNDNTTLNKCLNYMDKNPKVDAVGYTGVNYDSNQGYFNSPHYGHPLQHNLEVPIIKGRFMFIRKKSLEGLDMEPDLTCDDIKVCGHIKNKVLLSDIRGHLINLKEGDEAVFRQHGQHQKREIASKKYIQ